jgi:hypothetical protein
MKLIPNEGPSVRPLRVVARELEAQRERFAMRALSNEMEMNELVEQAKAGNMQGVAMMIQQMMQFMTGGQPEAQSEAELEQRTLSMGAYFHAGIHIEYGPDRQFKIWDFSELLAGAATIFRNPAGTIFIRMVGYCEGCSDGPMVEMTQDVADAFTRYLVFNGVFETGKLRVPCPTCKGELDEHGIPMYCKRCGALGWVIPHRDDSLEVGDRASSETSGSSGRSP